MVCCSMFQRWQDTSVSRNILWIAFMYLNWEKKKIETRAVEKTRKLKHGQQYTQQDYWRLVLKQNNLTLQFAKCLYSFHSQTVHCYHWVHNRPECLHHSSCLVRYLRMLPPPLQIPRLVATPHTSSITSCFVTQLSPTPISQDGLIRA